MAPALTSTGQPVPKPLDELEAQSEDVIDVVPGGKWDQVASDVATVDTAWAAYQTQGAADGAPDAILTGMRTAVAALDAASRAQDPTGTMQAANDLSAGVVELYGLYDVGRPVGIGRLDVIGRQIVLDAAAKDQAGVQQQIAAATAQVTALEPDLADHDGSKVIEQSHELLGGHDGRAVHEGLRRPSPPRPTTSSRRSTAWKSCTDVASPAAAALRLAPTRSARQCLRAARCGGGFWRGDRLGGEGISDQKGWRNRLTRLGGVRGVSAGSQRWGC